MSPLGQLGRFYIVMTLGIITGEPMGARKHTHALTHMGG